MSRKNSPDIIPVRGKNSDSKALVQVLPSPNQESSCSLNSLQIKRQGLDKEKQKWELCLWSWMREMVFSPKMLPAGEECDYSDPYLTPAHQDSNSSQDFWSHAKNFPIVYIRTQRPHHKSGTLENLQCPHLYSNRENGKQCIVTTMGMRWYILFLWRLLINIHLLNTFLWALTL